MMTKLSLYRRLLVVQELNERGFKMTLKKQDFVRFSIRYRNGRKSHFMQGKSVGIPINYFGVGCALRQLKLESELNFISGDVVSVFYRLDGGDVLSASYDVPSGTAEKVEAEFGGVANAWDGPLGYTDDFYLNYDFSPRIFHFLHTYSAKEMNFSLVEFRGSQYLSSHVLPNEFQESSIPLPEPILTLDFHKKDDGMTQDIVNFNAGMIGKNAVPLLIHDLNTCWHKLYGVSPYVDPKMAKEPYLPLNVKSAMSTISAFSMSKPCKIYSVTKSKG